MNEYHKQADDLLASFGVTFKVMLIGSDCPPFCDDAIRKVDMDAVDTYPRKTHFHGKHYRCTFSRGEHSFSVDYWNSYADEELLKLGSRDFRDGVSALPFNHRTPRPKVTAYAVITRLERDPADSFEDWCNDYGYDTDSRRAESIYQACQKQWREVVGFFTPEEIEKLREIS